MEAREKRIDLRLGAFACSLQGFDDPIPPLTRILQELRDVQAAMPDGGRPLFDAETLRRLEGEIAALAGGGVSAMPGLVLAPDVAADAEAAPAATARIPADVEQHAAPAEETAEAGSGPPAQPEADAPEGAGQGGDIPLPAADEAPEPSVAAGETDEGSAAAPVAPAASLPDEAEAEAPDPPADASTEPSAEGADGVEEPSEPEPEPASAAEGSPPPEVQENPADDDAAAENLFAPESDEDVGPGAAANLFDDPEPVVPEADSSSPAAPSADEAPVSESAAASALGPDDENLFAAEGEADAGIGGAGESLFADPEAAASETDAPTEAAAVEPSAAPESPAAEEAETPPAIEPDTEPAEGGVAPDEHAADRPHADDGGDGGAETNLFAPADAEGGLGINLFDDHAPEEGAGASAAAPEEGPDSDDAPIAPGAFRRLDRFNPHAPAEPDEEDLPPPRSFADVSAEELAKRARAEAPAELMAAAAAWLTVVRGHGSFTKREVLELFEALPGDHPRTAEVKVKGFGRLVRNGQVKLGDDQRFRLTEAERDRYEALLD